MKRDGVEALSSEKEGKHMKKYTVTVSREFGCGAREIARRLASELGVPLYDKTLVDLAAQRAGVNTEMFKDVDEVVVKKKSSAILKEFGYGSTFSFYSEEAIDAQAFVIRDIANKRESCIMFGRCADYILREHPNVVNFFLYAPMSYRISHIANSYDLDYREAEKLIRRVDRQRHSYYKYVTGKNRGDRSNKQMFLDVSAFGTEGSVKMMLDAVHYLYGTSAGHAD